MNKFTFNDIDLSKLKNDLDELFNPKITVLKYIYILGFNEMQSYDEEEFTYDTPLGIFIDTVMQENGKYRVFVSNYTSEQHVNIRVAGKNE